jgi:tRNA (guanine-N7-)-methyltransferase
VSRKLKYDIPGRDHRIAPDEFGEAPSLARWREIFAPDVDDVSELVVDIGFGRGEFLIDLARREPKRAFVGLERSFKRTLKMARRLARLEIANVRLVEVLAEQGIADLFPADSIGCAWINFPDPWPKDRHARRRLVQPAFIAALAQRLAPDGIVNLATDDPHYAEQMDAVLSDEPLLVNRYAPAAFRSETSGRVATAYELEWRALGRSFHYFSYGRSAQAPRRSLDTQSGGE